MLGAAWLDIWWACLVVPVALFTGIVIRQLLSSGFELESILLPTLLAFFGATLGTIFFKWRDVRRWLSNKSHMVLSAFVFSGLALPYPTISTSDWYRDVEITRESKPLQRATLRTSRLLRYFHIPVLGIS